MPLRAKITNPAFSDLQPKRMASSSVSIPKELPGDEPDDVLFNNFYGVRLIELNRPKKLNSLNGSMARKIIPRLREWQNSQMANIIVIAGAGEKAFCAGGDVAALAQQNNTPEGQKASTEYFELEYQLDHLIATYNKPYISFMDGITMGGGVGLSVHGPFRIATERTVFAMPETTIGFFPDVGGSFFLPRLDGEIGTYLALTSDRLNGRQAHLAGVATHYLHSSDLTNLTGRLSELVFEDAANYFDRLALVNSTIMEFTQPLPSASELPPTPNGDIAGPLRLAIDRCFSHSTISQIISALEETSNSSSSAPELSKWASATIKTLSSRSPTSLKVTLRQIRSGKSWSISETFIREHAMASQFMRHPDFVEGVSARLMSKPPRQAEWKPATLDEVSDEDVDKFFQVNRREQLQLLPAVSGTSAVPEYSQYPYVRLGLGLPNEETIQNIARGGKGEGKKTVGKAEVIRKLVEQYGKSMIGKQGLEEKIGDVLGRME